MVEGPTGGVLLSVAEIQVRIGISVTCIKSRKLSGLNYFYLMIRKLIK